MTLPWTQSKSTVNSALPEARAILGRAEHLTLTEYMNGMERAHVDPNAARAVLRFLEDQGVVEIEAMAKIHVRA